MILKPIYLKCKRLQECDCDYENMRKLIYVITFLLLTDLLQAEIVDRFDIFNSQDFTTTDNITLEFSSTVVNSTPGALKIIRNIK